MAPRTFAPSPLPAAAALALALAAGPAAAGDCPGGMTRVDGGTVELANGEAVRVQPFCLDRTEVTVDAYARCAEVGACPAEGLECGKAATWGRKGYGDHPVNCVTWDEAENFCREHGKRLPTEAEWEWAARGGPRGATYPWGDDPPADRACWDGDGNDLGKGERKGTCEVADHRAGRNPDGIHDLAGNVREWTSSPNGRFRVLRGGSWGDSLPEFLSTAFRGWNAPDERIELTGFRCAARIGAVAHRPKARPPPPKSQVNEDGALVVANPLEL